MLTRPREIYLATAVSIGILLSLIAPLGPPLARADGTSQLAELVDAAAERLEVADPVAAFKWRAQLPIEDSGRVEQQLAKLGEDARSQHIDPDYVTRVFDDQIRATRQSSTAGSRTGSSTRPARPRSRRIYRHRDRRSTP